MQRVKTYLIIIHIAGWLLFMAFPLLFLNNMDENNGSLAVLKSPFYWLFCLTYISLFYINAYFLIPALFLRKKFIAYSVVLICLFCGIYFLKPYDRLLKSTENKKELTMHGTPPANSGPPPMGPPPAGLHPANDRPFDRGDRRPPAPPPFSLNNKRPELNNPPHFVDTISLFIFLMIAALSTAVRTIEQLQITEQRVLLAETDKANAELSFLKAQVNPHFLFNTLNNIYTLALEKDDQAPYSIMKLSNIMRYITDDALEDFVPLQSELDFIADYIELQRMRLGEKTTVEINFAGNMLNKQIPPLLLITFIENIFKHGVSNRESSVIIIKVIAAEDRILFFCENRVVADDKQKTRTGTGLANTKKRLEHLYPGKHILNLSNEDGMFAVNLTLQN